jgi:uncharacterized Fe-S center protein
MKNKTKKCECGGTITYKKASKESSYKHFYECNKCKNECEVDAIDNGKINKKECICCGKCIDSCPCIKP